MSRFDEASVRIDWGAMGPPDSWYVPDDPCDCETECNCDGWFDDDYDQT